MNRRLIEHSLTMLLYLGGALGMSFWVRMRLKNHFVIAYILTHDSVNSR